MLVSKGPVCGDAQVQGWSRRHKSRLCPPRIFPPSPSAWTVLPRSGTPESDKVFPLSEEIRVSKVNLAHQYHLEGIKQVHNEGMFHSLQNVPLSLTMWNRLVWTSARWHPLLAKNPGYWLGEALSKTIFRLSNPIATAKKKNSQKFWKGGKCLSGDIPQQSHFFWSASLMEVSSVRRGSCSSSPNTLLTLVCAVSFELRTIVAFFSTWIYQFTSRNYQDKPCLTNLHGKYFPLVITRQLSHLKDLPIATFSQHLKTMLVSEPAKHWFNIHFSQLKVLWGSWSSAWEKIHSLIIQFQGLDSRCTWKMGRHGSNKLIKR